MNTKFQVPFLKRVLKNPSNKKKIKVKDTQTLGKPNLLREIL